MYGDNPYVEAVFENFLTYKNKFSGVISEHTGGVTYYNMTAIDNNLVSMEISSGDESPFGTARILDCKIVGYVEELYEYTGDIHVGIVTERGEGMMIDGVHFYNFNHDNEKYYAIKTCSKCDNCKRGGYTTVT